MKRLYFAALAAMMMFVGCSAPYDDSAIWEKFDEMEQEHDEMQEQIDAQQTLLNALANNLSIVSITPTEEGFILTFTDGSTITIKHGESGKDGDSFFQSITWDDENVYFILADGTEITIPLVNLVKSEPKPNEIWYTSTDGEVVTPGVFGVNIVSNIYENGKGIITFDGELTSVENYAFCNCSSLESITIPQKVTQLGARSFENCTSLTSIKISESVASIGEGAFAGCISLASFTIPDAITTVEPYTFCDCYALAELTIGNSVTTIKGWAFCDCIGLTTVIIPDNVVSMEGGVFGGCSGLERFEGNNVSADGRCLIFDGMLKAFAPAGLTEYAIPEGVTAIEVYTFQKLENITTISIPRGIERISEGAFESCPMLASFSTVNTDVKYIDKYAFQYCTGLTEVDINSVEEIGNDVFRGCTSLERVAINHVSDGLFSGCSSLKEVVICDGATSIGTSAFMGCTSLTSVTIPEGVTVIGVNAFSCCSSLASINIPNSVTLIEICAFDYCASLTSVTIPANVTSIGGWAFCHCPSLASFYGKFASDDNRCLIIDGVLNSFATGCGLTEYAIPDSVTSIGGGAFEGCTLLTSVTIPEGVISIGELAFYNCESLTEVYCKPTVSPVADAPYLYWHAFHNNAEGRKIYVPRESVERYKAAEGWSDYADHIEPHMFD